MHGPATAHNACLTTGPTGRNVRQACVCPRLPLVRRGWTVASCAAGRSGPLALSRRTRDTGYHDHAGSCVGVHVIEGRAWNEPLTIGEQPKAREYGPGETFWFPGEGIHRMDHQAGAVKRLIAELTSDIPRFVELWESGEVGLPQDQFRHKIIDHPDVGLIALDCDAFIVVGDDLRITVYTADTWDRPPRRHTRYPPLGQQRQHLHEQPLDPRAVHAAPPQIITPVTVNVDTVPESCSGAVHLSRQAVLPAPFANASGFAFGCVPPVGVGGDRVFH
jgi:MmyB-like transcription regulator ligand binding domain